MESASRKSWQGHKVKPFKFENNNTPQLLRVDSFKATENFCIEVK